MSTRSPDPIGSSAKNIGSDLRELAEPATRDEKVRSIIDRAARRAGLSYWRAYNIWFGKARRIEPEEREAIKAAWLRAMNSTNYGFGWPDSNRYWFKRTRNFIAIRLIRLGGRVADLAEVVAPWLRKPDPAQPPARTRIGYGNDRGEGQ